MSKENDTELILPEYDHDAAVMRHCRLIEQALFDVDAWHGGKEVKNPADELRKKIAPYKLEECIDLTWMCLHENDWWFKVWFWYKHNWLFLFMNKWKRKNKLKQLRKQAEEDAMGI